tara:strand:+ start:148 stop:1221 length:1074 start_codon:yes stop_codon:yes gene_type:complete
MLIPSNLEMSEKEERKEEREKGKAKKDRWSLARARMLIPSNLDLCRKNFLSDSQSPESPIFSYMTCDSERSLKLSSSLRTSAVDLLSHAKEILQRAVEQYGRGNVLLASDPPLKEEREEMKTGTTYPLRAHLNRKHALKYLCEYMTTNRLDSHCTVKFCDDLPSAGIFINRPRATMARIRCEDAYFGGDDDCKHSLLVSNKLLSSPESTVSALRLVSFAVHEIGTHLVRRSNEEIQPWLRKRNRYDMVKDERLIKATEEGLAMVHEAMHLPSQLLARPALYYFASARASQLSFVDLFAELAEFVANPIQRFDVSVICCCCCLLLRIYIYEVHHTKFEPAFSHILIPVFVVVVLHCFL